MSYSSKLLLFALTIKRIGYTEECRKNKIRIPTHLNSWAKPNFGGIGEWDPSWKLSSRVERERERCWQQFILHSFKHTRNLAGFMMTTPFFLFPGRYEGQSFLRIPIKYIVCVWLQQFRWKRHKPLWNEKQIPFLS